MTLFIIFAIILSVLMATNMTLFIILASILFVIMAMGMLSAVLYEAFSASETPEWVEFLYSLYWG